MFLLAKLMGEKQINQLSLFDYMVGITVGSIAAEFATDLENPAQPLTAMIIYGLAAFAVSTVTIKSRKLRKLLNGTAVVIMDRGRIYRANLAASHLEINDFITMCRSQGYFDLAQIETAILEYNGTVSILPKSKFRPLTPNDNGQDPPVERSQINVILDGKILYDKLGLAGVEEKWLNRELSAQGYNRPDDIALACVDNNKNLLIIPMVREKNDADWFA